MVLAGESSGSMPLVLRRLAVYYDNRDKLVRKVRGALAYPMFVVGFIFVIITVMTVYIIPQFLSIFETIKGNLAVPVKPTRKFSTHYTTPVIL